MFLCSIIIHDLILAAVAFSNAYFGEGSGPIQMDDVGCIGTETILVQCSHLTTVNCMHAEDAGVRCGIPGRY